MRAVNWKSQLVSSRFRAQSGTLRRSVDVDEGSGSIGHLVTRVHKDSQSAKAR